MAGGEVNWEPGARAPNDRPLSEDSGPATPRNAELARKIQEFDWGITPIGPAQAWPSSLKTAVGIMLTSRQPIWIGWGPELTYLYNDPYKSIIGGKHPWALGKPASVVWREIWSEIGPMLSQAMEGREGTYVEAQLLIMERNGYPEETYYTFSYSAIAQEDGTVGGIFCANTDDTQRVIGERQLALLRELAAAGGEARTWQQACERSAEALGTNSRDLPFAMIYVLEPDGRTAVLASATGIGRDHPAAPPHISLDDASAWPLAEVAADHKPRLVSDLKAVFRTDFPAGAWQQSPNNAVILPIAPSAGEGGRAAFLIAGLNPFRLYDDKYSGFMNLIAGQIAAAIANAEAYAQERRRAEALAEVDRAKTAFFSNVSHEFRTPLTLMLSPLEELIAKPEALAAPESMELVSIAQRNGVRLLKLVNSLLDFSRIEAGRAQARFEPVDLPRLTAEVAAAFEPVVKRAGLTLRIDCPPLAQKVFVDRDMWEKIVLNLLSNAFKFTFAGEISVIVWPSADGQSAELSVSDTGVGIPPNHLPHVFERFHRVEDARGRSIEGSGIGLALVQELVKLHGGRVTVDSEMGRGARFRVVLPFGTGHLPADNIVANEQAMPTSVRAQAYLQEAASWLGAPRDAADTFAASGPQDIGGASIGRPGQQHLVLVADDNPDMRHYIERLLTAADYRVRTASDGAQALRLARELRPELILSDVMMPELDGFGLLAALRGDDELKDIPMILLSARAGEEAKIEGIRAGADDYLVKPFSPRELMARVETNVHLATARRETAHLLEEETQTLELLNRVGTTVAAELDLETAVQVVTNTATELSGAAFGSFLYKVTGSEAESYTLDTLSGAPREVFAKLALPNAELFAPTFRTNGVIRSSDLTRDAALRQNEPCFAMLEWHGRARSYLAVPVVSRGGEVLGGLCFGHPEPDRFDARAERIVRAIGVQAAVAIDKARLYQVAQDEIERRKRVEATLRESEQQLEMRVAERTAELAAANATLLQAVEQRERTERIFQHLVEGVTDYALFMLDPNGIVTSWNTGAERIKGYRDSEIIGRHFENFYTPEDRAAGVPARALATAEREGKFEAEGLRVRKDGSQFFASVVINPIRDKQGRLRGFAKITRDITERRRAQAELQSAQEHLVQVQKMESIGQLTGGVAHDFNNLLTIIIGNLESVQRSLDKAPLDATRLRRWADNAMRGAQRAASLTQRLLAFARRQPLEPKPVDLGRLINGMSELIRRALGEQIAFETVLAGGLWRVHVDPNQLEVSILNLAVNARDAMTNGGKLTVEAANVYLDEGYAAGQAEVAPGQYVVISISDNGTGMTREVMDRVFEPFYTTKDIGQGTGLGLPQVYGFVKQSGGNVKIYSEVGHGTTVKIYLPRLQVEEAAASVVPDVAAQAPRGSQAQTILAVEDEEDVRAYSTGILRELGYRVLEAGDAASGLRMLREHPEIVLLFTDVGLPGGMNGKQLADTAQRLRPDLKIVFTTGYARNAIVHHGRLDAGVTLIPKPFTYAALAAKLGDALESRSEKGSVLLVEDEALVQMLGVEYLEELGYRVETAASATEAMRKAQQSQGKYDLVVVDLGLPDRKGDVLVGELRALYPRLRVIIASGYDDSELRKRLGDDGHISFLRKPYGRDDLEAAVDAVGKVPEPSV